MFVNSRPLGKQVIESLKSVAEPVPACHAILTNNDRTLYVSADGKLNKIAVLE